MVKALSVSSLVLAVVVPVVPAVVVPVVPAVVPAAAQAVVIPVVPAVVPAAAVAPAAQAVPAAAVVPAAQAVFPTAVLWFSINEADQSAVHTPLCRKENDNSTDVGVLNVYPIQGGLGWHICSPGKSRKAILLWLLTTCIPADSGRVPHTSARLALASARSSTPSVQVPVSAPRRTLVLITDA